MLSSLRFKIIFLTLVPTTIIYFTILFFSVNKINQNEIENMTKEMHQYTRYYASYYASYLRETMQIANVSASFLQHNLQLSKSQLYSMVKKNVELNPLVFGSAIAFDYEKLSNKDLFFAPYAYRTDENIKTVNIATVSDYTKSDWEWWIRAVEDNKPIWTAPFFSKERGNILMATYAVPFFDRNELIGVTTVDVELSPLERSVSKILPADLEFMILTKKGNYLYNSHKKDILKRSIYDDFKENNNPQVKQLADEMTSAKTGMIKISTWDKYNKDIEWFFYRPIPMTDWSFAVRVKEDKIIEKIRAEGLNLSLILLASLIVIVFVIWFAIGRITAPLARLTQNVKDVAIGKLDSVDISNIESSNNDEIGILAKTFSQMKIDLQKREEDLRQVRSKGFSHIVSQLSGKYFYFSHDRQGKITFVSEEVKKVLGYSREAFKEHYLDYLTDNPVNKNAEKKTTLLLNGRHQQSVEIEILCAHKKKHRLEVIEVPIYDDNHNIIAIEGMAHDITQRRKEEEKFKVLFESSSEANIIFNKEKILDCNHAFLGLFNYATKDQVVDLSPCALCPELQPDGQESIDIVSAAMQRAHQSNNIKIILTLQDKNRRQFPAEMSITALAVSDSLFYIGIIHDMTIRLRAEQEIITAKETAEKANRAKSDFLSNMSHELRTPLNGVLGYAQILQNSPDNTNLQVQNLDAIESCGRHLLTLINDVLDLSKIESGVFEIQDNTFELKKFIYALYDIVLPKAESKGIKLILDLNDDLPELIKTDDTKLRQILINLIGNAIKFTDQGSVTLSLSQQTQTIKNNQRLVFSIVDTGIGIDKNKYNDIFDAFKQTKQGIEAGGTGLGLAISRHLVRILGYSNIILESSLGKGSSFSFSMPLDNIDETNLISNKIWMDTSIPKLEDNQLCNALVVDDRAINVDILVNFLKLSGFNVEYANSGEQAIKIAKNKCFSLILMDIKMPGMDGIETTQYLRNMPKYKSATIFAVTANLLPEVNEQIYQAKFDDLIHKPVTISELFGKIRLHMDVKFKQQDRLNKTENKKRLKEDVKFERLNEFVDKLKVASSYGDIESLNKLLKEYKNDCNIPMESENELERLINHFDFKKIEHFADELLNKFGTDS